MPSLLTHVDPDGLLEYSVVYTDRAVNHMSCVFQETMRDIYRTLREVYRADTVAVVPGSGTFGMEAVARQFATGKKCLIIRNGWFSFRWTQILDAGRIASSSSVLKAAAVHDGRQAPFAPPPLDRVVAAIRSERPGVVFAPHVETASGMLLPDEYVRETARAVHEVGGLMVLDCIASGALWVDMEDTGVDVLVSAPQKGWSGSPCCALVMMNERSAAVMGETRSTSFACDLGKWYEIMQAYVNGGHAYHATMPTDSLLKFRDVMQETETYGFDRVMQEQVDLGGRVRAALESRGFVSVAAEGYKAPGVVVSYTDDAGIQNGSKFAAEGLQIAAGVPLQCDEPADFMTFRLGLFGLDKLHNPQRTVEHLESALDRILPD